MRCVTAHRLNYAGLYNLRADERTGRVGLHSEELAAELVVLYGPVLERVSLWRVSGDPRLMNRQRMLAMNYPNPRGELHYCLPVESIGDMPHWLAELTYTDAERLVQKLAPERP